jgi:hypothetical protein
MLGALGGGYLATFEVKRRGRDPEMVWDLLVYLIIGGVLGARLWHILTPPPSSIAQGYTTLFYLTHPLDALAIWKGGLGIPGTIIGGLIALYLYTRQHREIAFLEWADIAAPSLALGQAIGRWGNFVNQEIYGAATNLPWKIYIDPAHRLAGFENESFYHPCLHMNRSSTLPTCCCWSGSQGVTRATQARRCVQRTWSSTGGALRLDFYALMSEVLAPHQSDRHGCRILAIALLWRHQSVFTSAGAGCTAANCSGGRQERKPGPR